MVYNCSFGNYKKLQLLTVFTELIAARQGGFIVPYVWEIVVRKNLTIFEGCHFPRFYIIDLIKFRENRDKEFQFGPILVNLVELGRISPAAHFIYCVHIGRSQKMAAIICGLSSGKWFVKLNRFLRSLNYEHGKKIYRGALKSRYWNLFVLLLLYTCILELRENIFYFYFYMMNFISNQFNWTLTLHQVHSCFLK